ncbi:MAG: GNAT family N-acetyltransferase [Clostridia bacterium]|nr:GNAT family N-acetyltransferase [Clostridia bacterium]MBR6668726.1 GNAT family N-acetyltransferase [Clostridia bacterium]
MLNDYLTAKPTLETSRLILRSLVPEDAASLRRWLARDEIYTYWGRKASKGEREPELMFIDPRPWVKRKPDPDFKWGIVLKETNAVIGDVSIFDIENARMGSVGYRLDPDLWGHGYVTEALRAAVEFIFTHTELDRLHATADVRNTASNRVLEKCGFVHEGTIRHGKMVSVYCDYHIWGLLREDWEQMKATT